MLILVNTDNHIKGSLDLTAEVESVLTGSLQRFEDRITRVEVYLSDQNSRAKTGESDKRCAIEARLSGLDPIAVHHQDESVAQAVDGAVEKLRTMIARTLDRLQHVKGQTSYGGDQTI